MAGHNSRDQSIRFSATLNHMVNVSKGEKVIIVFLRIFRSKLSQRVATIQCSLFSSLVIAKYDYNHRTGRFTDR